MSKKVNKRQAAIDRAERWKQALREHRVVRYADGLSFTAFKTAELAAAEAAECEGATVIIDYQW